MARALGMRRPGSYQLQAAINAVHADAATFEQTVENINRLGLRLFELPQWYDIDTFADLDLLCKELRSDNKARNQAPATHGWLLAHDLLRLPVD